MESPSFKEGEEVNIDDRPVFEVTGTVLDVAGSDGEPLIADATARRVHPTAVETTI